MMTKQVKDDICTITIDHPPMNTLNKEVIEQLAVYINELYEDSSIRAVIITGAGYKAFVAGAEISEFLTLDEASGEELVRKGHEVFSKIEQLPIPVIAAINGYALGGGLELALVCDIRIMEVHTKVGLPETTLGIIPGYGGTQRLARLVGTGRAKELIFSGRYVDAEEALQLGIVEKVVPTGEAYQQSIVLANSIKKKAPLAISAAKKAIDEGIALPINQAIEVEIKYNCELFGTADLQEGAKAFFEKREANFIGS